MTDAEIKEKIEELRDDNEALEDLLPDDDVQEELDRNLDEIQKLKDKFENIRLSEEVDEEDFDMEKKKSGPVSDEIVDVVGLMPKDWLYKEGGKTEHYQYSVIVSRENAYRFKKGLEKLGYGWDSYDEKERYANIHFGLTQSQYNNVKKNSDILKLAEEVDEFGVGGFVLGLVAGGYVGYKIGVLQPQRETKDLLKTEKALYKELKKKKKGKKTDKEQEPKYTEYEDVTYEKNYAKGGKIKKYTQKDNIIRKTSSKNSYAIIDNNGKEIEVRLTLDDAKEVIKELNQKSKFKRTGERAGFDMRGIYAKGGRLTYDKMESLIEEIDKPKWEKSFIKKIKSHPKVKKVGLDNDFFANTYEITWNTGEKWNELGMTSMGLFFQGEDYMALALKITDKGEFKTGYEYENIKQVKMNKFDYSSGETLKQSIYDYIPEILKSTERKVSKLKPYGTYERYYAKGGKLGKNKPYNVDVYFEDKQGNEYSEDRIDVVAKSKAEIKENINKVVSKRRGVDLTDKKHKKVRVVITELSLDEVGWEQADADAHKSIEDYAKGGSVSGTLKHNENIYVEELEKENYVNLEKLLDDLEATDLPLLNYYIEGNISQSELYKVRKIIVNQNATAEIGYFDGIKEAKEDKVFANSMKKEGKTPFQETEISIQVVDRSKNRFKFRYIVDELNKIFGKRADGFQLWKDGEEISGWYAKGGKITDSMIWNNMQDDGDIIEHWASDVGGSNESVDNIITYSNGKKYLVTTNFDQDMLLTPSKIATEWEDEYAKGGNIPKGHTKELETEDFIWYVDENGEYVIMIRKSDGSVVSDNYFAENDLYERMVEIANGREKYIYLRPESKQYLKEFKEDYAKGGVISIYEDNGETMYEFESHDKYNGNFSKTFKSLESAKKWAKSKGYDDLDVTEYKYEKGGKTFEYDPNIDYFSEYELLPNNIQELMFDEGELEDYRQTEKLLQKLEEKGWTFEYGLGNEVYDLRPIMKSEKYGSEYKKDEDTLFYRPMDSNEEWSEVSDEAFDEEERKEFDKEMESIFKEKVKFEKGGLLRVLKDSGFNHHKGSPKNELKHNRGQYIATIGKDNMGEVVHLDIYTPNTKRFLSSTSFDNPKKLADYFDKNQLYAKGGKTKKSKPAPRKPISIKRGRDRSSGLRRMYGFAKGGRVMSIERLAQKLERAYPDIRMRENEDSISVFEDFPTDRRGDNIADYYSESEDRVFGMANHFDNFLKRNGYWAEWVNPEHFKIYKLDNYAKGGTIEGLKNQLKDVEKALENTEEGGEEYAVLQDEQHRLDSKISQMEFVSQLDPDSKNYNPKTEIYLKRKGYAKGGQAPDEYTGESPVLGYVKVLKDFKSSTYKDMPKKGDILPFTEEKCDRYDVCHSVIAWYKGRGNEYSLKDEMRGLYDGDVQYTGKYFAKGGETDDVIMIEIGGDKKYPYYIKKIDTTHIAMANNKDGVDLVVPSHILQHKGESYYDDVRSWLRGGASPNGKSYDSDYYAKGGDLQEKIRVVNKSKIDELENQKGKIESEIEKLTENDDYDSQEVEGLNQTLGEIYEEIRILSYGKEGKPKSKFAKGGKTEPNSGDFFKEEVDEYGYSYSNYKNGEWEKIYNFLIKEGNSREETKEIMLSKHTRWALDEADGGKSEGGTLKDFKKYYKKYKGKWFDKGGTVAEMYEIIDVSENNKFDSVISFDDLLNWTKELAFTQSLESPSTITDAQDVLSKNNLIAVEFRKGGMPKEVTPLQSIQADIQDLEDSLQWLSGQDKRDIELEIKRLKREEDRTLQNIREGEKDLDKMVEKLIPKPKPKTKPKKKAKAKPKKKKQSKEELLEEIESDMSSFSRRVNGSQSELNVDDDAVVFETRYLGNWSLPEDADEDDDEYQDYDWEEWDDYGKYHKIFKDWAKSQKWYKKVNLDLDVSEKNWVYFAIRLK
tara:strand:+ start:1617 stop:7373 length:5757 start_codon:yes stop_codon:yes gene_type:complete